MSDATDAISAKFITTCKGVTDEGRPVLTRGLQPEISKIDSVMNKISKYQPSQSELHRLRGKVANLLQLLDNIS